MRQASVFFSEQSSASLSYSPEKPPSALPPSSAGAGMLVLFSDYRQLVEAQGRFQEALSRSQDAVREATSTQHRGSVLDTGMNMFERTGAAQGPSVLQRTLSASVNKWTASISTATSCPSSFRPCVCCSLCRRRQVSVAPGHHQPYTSVSSSCTNRMHLPLFSVALNG